MEKYTEQQIKEMRKKWDIAEDFVPVAKAAGVVAWAKEKKELVNTLRDVLDNSCALHSSFCSVNAYRVLNKAMERA